MIAYILILTGFLMRLMPHTPNIAPIAAIALFSGAYLNKKIVPWVPLVIMIFSDMIIGFHSVIPYTWGAFVLIGYMGMKLREDRTPVRILGMTISSALVFFMISNFGVWLGWYPHTVSGIVDCYIKAIPFLRNTLASNIVFGLGFFGVYELSKRLAGNSRFSNVLLVEHK